uniref:Uncharacterized protein n=1 Tax=Lepeophtheirus salmonis TaxID=72036 RepID=A0A0K2ULS0_LEPSM
MLYLIMFRESFRESADDITTKSK